jgi:hypothetical protein
LIDLNSIVSSMIALTGALTTVRATTGKTVTIHGQLPPTGFNGQGGLLGQGNVGGIAAALTVSAASPYYPLSLTYVTDNATTTYEFGSWGKQANLPSVRGALALPNNFFGGAPSEPQTVTEANLETALTAAKAYYTENGQTYSGLDARTFRQIDGSLTIVPGSQAPNGSNSASLASQPQSAEVAAWSAANKTCYAIIDITDTGTVDGLAGPGTLFASLAGHPRSSCKADTFAGRSRTAGSVASTNGWAGSSAGAP